MRVPRVLSTDVGPESVVDVIIILVGPDIFSSDRTGTGSAGLYRFCMCMLASSSTPLRYVTVHPYTEHEHD